MNCNIWALGKKRLQGEGGRGKSLILDIYNNLRKDIHLNKTTVHEVNVLYKVCRALKPVDWMSTQSSCSSAASCAWSASCAWPLLVCLGLRACFGSVNNHLTLLLLLPL